jgi:hypothetical protein
LEADSLLMHWWVGTTIAKDERDELWMVITLVF